MIPVLFRRDATNFSTNGIGGMSEAISCTVTYEVNGVYELEMQYPIIGRRTDDIQVDRLIRAVPYEGGNPQAFRIYKISKPLNGIVTINAEHISYQLRHIPVMPFTAISAKSAMQKLKEYSAEDNPFYFYTDITSSAEFKLTEPVALRSALGGMEGSMLDTYGGELVFDGHIVSLEKAEERDDGFAIRYGKNMTDITHEEDMTDTYTGVCPFWKGENDDGVEELVTLPEKVVRSMATQRYAYWRTLPLDLSGEFENKPTVDRLRNKAKAYMSSNKIGSPRMSIDVSFIPTWQIEANEELKSILYTKPRETVTVIYEALGINVKAKVVKTVYDVINDRYDSLEIGNIRRVPKKGK